MSKRDELVAHLNRSISSNGGDPEKTHSTAETLLKEMLIEMGEKELAYLWDMAQEDWWYA